MSDQLKWFKSSYSDDEGGNCVEVALPTPQTGFSNLSGAVLARARQRGPSARKCDTSA
ncbi:DUF397 domain-containing protein, partial [Streptomyces sp. NPDC058469]|uniref:DUF397 domain-containing protein n=1 Tax=Streptomyces sp. NPDC058469 TaxID=3346514 RepID=UPI0036694489